MDFRILELFSGIGGMHYAFQYSKLPGQVVAAYDINTVANSVYSHNFPMTKIKNNNIQSLNVETIRKLDINMLLMSPPCQPHTRVGNKLDIEDSRSDALSHICTLLPKCSSLQYILMENVKGFEKSKARDVFVEALSASGFFYCELILSPTEFGVPNARHRYYCIARKGSDFAFSTSELLEQMPMSISFTNTKKCVRTFLEADSQVSNDVYVNDNDLLKRVWLMDIVTSDSTNTMCFTKAYTHYAEGTGSVYSPLALHQLDQIFKCLKSSETEEGSTSQLELLRNLKLRYFTPREVARLMSFPETMQFPASITNRQRYRLLGNSLNVVVVGELIKLLCA